MVKLLMQVITSTFYMKQNFDHLPLVSCPGKMVIDKAPINIMKNGQDIMLKPDSEYPGWLWKLLDARESLDELKKKPNLDFSEVGTF